jgi:hypothetical protein
MTTKAFLPLYALPVPLYIYISSATTNNQAGWSAEVEVEVETRFGDLSGTLLSTSPN